MTPGPTAPPEISQQIKATRKHLFMVDVKLIRLNLTQLAPPVEMCKKHENKFIVYMDVIKHHVFIEFSS